MPSVDRHRVGGRVPSPRRAGAHGRGRAGGSELTVAGLMDRIRDERDSPVAFAQDLSWRWECSPDQPTVRIGHRAGAARLRVGPWVAGALASATVLSTSLVVSHLVRPGAPGDGAGAEQAVSDAGNHTVYTPGGVPGASRIPSPRRAAPEESAPGGTAVPGGWASGPPVGPGAPERAGSGLAPEGVSPDDDAARRDGRAAAVDRANRGLGGGGALSRLDGGSGRLDRPVARSGGGGDVTGGGGSRGCDTPGHILNLSEWKLTLPTGSGGSPTEVVGSALGSLTGQDWFGVGRGCAVAFRAPVNGVTTSGSKNPRSELREMADGGSQSAGWSSTSGTHTMVLREAFTKLPSGKPQVVGGQIHDASDDISVFRLEGSNLYVTNGNDPHYQLVTSNYVLGSPFEAKYVVSGGMIRAYYNGRLVATIAKDFSGAYFKAGAYTQANCQDASPCSSGNYGEVMVYSLRVTHT